MSLSIQHIGEQTSAFFRWWLYALSQLTPTWLRRFFYTPPNYLFIRIQNFQVYLSCYENGSERHLLDFFLHEEGRQKLAAFFKAQPQWLQTTKILLLSPQQCLKKRLDLPLAAQDNLLQVLGYELDRYTPFNQEQCYFTTQIVGKNKASNRLLLELIFIAKTKLEHYCDELKALDLAVDAISHEQDRQHYHTQAFRQHYNLLPSRLQTNLDSSLTSIKRLLAACLVALSCVAIALPFWSQHQRLETLQKQLSTAKKQALDVEALKTETTQLVQLEKKLNDLKQEAPVILNVIEQLSSLLPKDTWLRSFEYKNNTFLLQGASASSSKLIELLESSPYFKQTTMVSPVTRDSEDGMDEFQLETLREPPNDPR